MKLNTLIQKMDRQGATEVVHNLQGVLIDYNRPGATALELNGERFMILFHEKDIVFTDADGNVEQITRIFTVSL